MDESSETDDLRPYIIQMDVSTMPSPFATHESWYFSMLSSLSVSSNGRDAPMHLYTYTHAMHGFSAVLTTSQLAQIEQTHGHVATFPESYARLLSTHTPKYLGLKPDLGPSTASNHGSDVVIGIIDTGVWPESKSFTDEGMPPIPKRWKGKCESGTQFNSSLCNRKLIGARFFSKGLKQFGGRVSRKMTTTCRGTSLVMGPTQRRLRQEAPCQGQATSAMLTALHEGWPRWPDYQFIRPYSTMNLKKQLQQMY